MRDSDAKYTGNVCWGADATIALADGFAGVEPEACGTGDKDVCGSSKSASLSAMASWPPHPGDYVLGDPSGTVAVCTLSNRDLPLQLIAEPGVAIAGRCDTENIGVEKVVLNLLANPRIRWLVICGHEAKGHRAGDAFLRLKERGVDTNMRVLESASWRPILENLTLLDVAQFREQIEEVSLIGVIDPDRILAAIRDCASKPLLPIPTAHAESACCDNALAAVEHIRAKAPKRLQLDRAGFFIVLPQPRKGLIICEHYENSGRLAHVIEGRQAALIAATAVERGFVTQLDHTVYLGRELAKAEAALSIGIAYEQDAALGQLPTSQKRAEAHKSNGYLLDQFLQDGSNKRTDSNGGSVENRVRLLLEVTEAVACVMGADRVGVRISPASQFNEMADSDPQTTFGYVAKELNRYGLAYLHIIEPRINGTTLVGEGFEPVAVTTCSEMDMPAVAVFGATRHTGRFVVAEPLRRGIRPIAIARDPAALAATNCPESKVDRRHATVDRRFSQSVRRNTGGFQVPSSAARKGP